MKKTFLQNSRLPGLYKKSNQVQWDMRIGLNADPYAANSSAAQRESLSRQAAGTGTSYDESNQTTGGSGVAIKAQQARRRAFRNDVSEGLKAGPKQYQKNRGALWRNTVGRALYNAQNVGSADWKRSPTIWALSKIPGINWVGKNVFGIGDQAQSFQDWQQREYEDAGDWYKNLLRYAPWQKDWKAATEKYMLPFEFYKKDGSLDYSKKDENGRPVVVEEIAKRRKAWQADAKAHGYPTDVRYFNYLLTHPLQKQKEAAQTETNSILPVYGNRIALELQISRVQKALKDPANSEQRAYLLKKQQELFRQKQQLRQYIDNLPTRDKIRLVLTPASGITAAAALTPVLPGAVSKFGPGLLRWGVTDAVANGLAQTGQQLTDWWNKDDKAVAIALAKGDVDDPLVQEYAQKLKIDLNDPKSRVEAAIKLWGDAQKAKKTVDSWVRFGTYMFPKNMAKNGLKSIFPRFIRGGKPIDLFLTNGVLPQTFKGYGRDLIGQAAMDQAWHYVLPSGGPQFPPQIAAAIAAKAKTDEYNPYFNPNSELFDFSVSGEKEGNAASRIGDAFLLGIPGMAKEYFEKKELGTPRAVSGQDYLLAKQQVQAQTGRPAEPKQIQAKVNSNRWMQTIKEQFLRISGTDVFLARNSLLRLAGQLPKLSQMTPQQQKQWWTTKFNDFSKTKGRGSAAAIVALEDNEFRRAFFAKVAPSLEDVNTFLDTFNIPEEITSDAQGKLIRDNFITAARKQLKQRYESGLPSAEDPFTFVRQYKDLAKKAEAKFGVKLGDDPQIEQYTKKILWDHIEKNPLNIHKMLALMAYEAGYNSLGDFLNSPGAFYGTLIGLPLTVMLMSSIFGGGNNNQPQQVPQQPNQWQFPAQYSIADRGLIAQ